MIKRHLAMALGLVLLVQGTGIAVGDRKPDLKEDLKDLNVRHRTEHYALAGTVSDAKLAEYGRCLEYIYKEYATGFAELLETAAGGQEKAPEKKPRRSGRRSGRRAAEPKRSSEKEEGEKEAGEKEAGEPPFDVVIFATQADYQAFGGRYLSGQTEHTGGMFIPSDNLLLILDRDDPDDVYGTLFHEAFHQFLHRYAKFAPLWVNEGLACFYETAKVGRGGLRLDQPNRYYFQVVKQVAGVRQLIPLGDLMTVSHRTFQDKRAMVPTTSIRRNTLYYAQSYTLVAYLLNSREGRSHLRRYLRDIAAATTPEEAQAVTRQHFPPKLLERMVPGWLAMADRL